MTIPARCMCSRSSLLPLVALTLAGCLVAGCATRPAEYQSLGLERRPAQFSQGRVTVVLLDEYGIAMPGLKVDMSWEEPIFYKTSAFTNRQGEVTFSGVPDVAEVQVDHPGGFFATKVIVPQTGRPELRLMLDTQGQGEAMRQRERERLAPPRPAPQPAAAGQ